MYLTTPLPGTPAGNHEYRAFICWNSLGVDYLRLVLSRCGMACHQFPQTLSMRRCLLLTSLILSLTVPAQTTWWGMTSLGGENNVGTIYTITEGNVYTKWYDFSTIPGRSPRADVLKASNGLYYGTTEFGGTDDAGVLFSYNPANGVYTVLQNFSSSTSGGTAIGNRPARGLAELTVSGSQRIYGTCQLGGTSNKGTIWEWNITTSVFTLRATFTGANGEEPFGGLVEGTAGVLFGTTSKGGANNTGSIFRFTPPSTLSLRVSMAAAPLPFLQNATGRAPRAGLIKAQNGKLYGSCSGGGTNGAGTVFEFATGGTTITAVSLVDATMGSVPFGEFVQFTNNSLYGTCTDGGANGIGSIIRIDASVSPLTITKVYDFQAGTNGNFCAGRLIKSANNLIYGTTNAGGLNNGGVIFSFNPTGDVYTKVSDLNTGGFAGSFGGLAEDGSGVLVGLALDGGAASSGALYRYTVASNTFNELVAFSFSNGARPRGRLTKATNGLFYGLTSNGGLNNKGVLFSFDPTTSTYTLRHTFGTGTGGDFPLGSLIEVNGKLYGTCSEGGNSGQGTLFEYTLSTNTMVKKVDLVPNSGGVPKSGLFKASNGTLYLMTSVGGGVNNKGSILSYVAGSTSITSLFSFSTTTGSMPLGDLMQASNGLLYGTLSADGAASAGTLFSFNPVGNVFQKLVDMDVLLGGFPSGDLIQASNGKLYGMAREGGTNAGGTLFSWDIGLNLYTQEYDLTAGTEGSFSESNLIQGTDGLLYGTSSAGGTNGSGTLFRFNPTTLSFTVLQTLAGITSGQAPFDGLASELAATSPSLQLNARVILEGPYVSGTGLMNDALRVLGTFPLSEPYTALGYTNVVTGSTTPPVLAVSGNNAIVDWVLVELRNKTNNTQVITAIPALLQRDGDIVAVDGISTLSINQPADLYFVAVRHRNHLGVLTLNTVALSGTPTSVDLTTGSVPLFGTAAQKQVGSAWTSWAGNTAPNNQLKYTGASNDRDPILVAIGGSTPTNTLSGYRAEDCNLDGVVKYTGASNDRDIILLNIGGSSPTATRTEQLP